MEGWSAEFSRSFQFCLSRAWIRARFPAQVPSWAGMRMARCVLPDRDGRTVSVSSVQPRSSATS